MTKRRRYYEITPLSPREREALKAIIDAMKASDDMHPGGLQDARRTRRALAKLKRGLFKKK